MKDEKDSAARTTFKLDEETRIRQGVLVLFAGLDEVFMY